jgi:uncharacterized protein YegP (UPF0339 family)
MTNTVEVFQDAGGDWRWHVKAANGQIVSTSGEAYASKANAVRAAMKHGGGGTITLLETPAPHKPYDQDADSGGEPG